MAIPPELRKLGARAKEKTERLGASYSHGAEEFQKRLKATMTENPIFEQLPGRLHRPGQKIPVRVHTISLKDYAAQLNAAGEWERDFLAGLKAKAGNGMRR